jgi:hypothetical protein
LSYFDVHQQESVEERLRQYADRDRAPVNGGDGDIRTRRQVGSGEWMLNARCGSKLEIEGCTNQQDCRRPTPVGGSGEPVHLATVYDLLPAGKSVEPQSRLADEVEGLSPDGLSPEDLPPDRGLSDLLLDSDLVLDPVFSLEPDFSSDPEEDEDFSDDPFEPPESVELELLARESVT